LTALAVAAVLTLAPAIDRTDECRYATADGRYGYTTAEVARTIRCAADRLGVPAADALAVGRCESGLRPAAVNGPYRSVYQIGPVWESWRRSFDAIRRHLDLRPRPSVWNVRAHVVIALARARSDWSPWPGCAP
jgi:hypothetical protein